MASRTRNAALLALIALVLIVAASVIAPRATYQSSVTGAQSLELDGIHVGYLRSFIGCRPQSDVVTTTIGADGTYEKHIANLRYEPCALTFGNTMGKPLYDWIQAAFEHKAARKDLVIVLSDYNFKEMSRLSISSAAISSVLLPELNASSKDAAFITLEVQPELVRSLPTSGPAVPQQTRTVYAKWLLSSYRVEMDNVTQPWIARMSPIGLRIPLAETSMGEMRDATTAPGAATLDNINVSLASSKADDFTAWAEDFIVKGNNAASNERTIRVSYLSYDLQKTHFQVTLRGVGIYGGDIYLPATSPAAAEKVPQSTFFLYAEEASFVATPGGVA